MYSPFFFSYTPWYTWISGFSGKKKKTTLKRIYHNYGIKTPLLLCCLSYILRLYLVLFIIPSSLLTRKLRRSATRVDYETRGTRSCYENLFPILKLELRVGAEFFLLKKQTVIADDRCEPTLGDQGKGIVQTSLSVTYTHARG